MTQLTEDIDTGDAPQLFHKSKQDLYKQPIGIEQLMPNLGPDAQRYIELVTSDSYKDLIRRLGVIVNRPVNTVGMPELIGMVMSALQRVTLLQRGHEKVLEKMALDVVFELEEFKLFKDMYEKGVIKFDIKLDSPDLSNAISSDDLELPQEQPTGPEGEEEEPYKGANDELTNAELMNVAMADALGDADEALLKRKFANMVTQGNAVNKLYLFNLASDRLTALHPDLVNLYGILSVVVQVLYYAQPNIKITKELANAASVGSEEVIPTEDIYTIKVRSPFFPYLIHEIVKGLYDYLSMDLVSQKGLDQEVLDDEVMDIISGPNLYTRLTSGIPTNKAKLTPLVYKLLLQTNQNTIREVLLGGGRSQAIVKRLLDQAANMLADHEESLDGDKWEDT